jgi:hypothetical protein
MHAWEVSRVHDMDMGRIAEFAGTGTGVDAAIPLKFLLPLFLSLHLPSQTTTSTFNSTSPQTAFST